MRLSEHFLAKTQPEPNTGCLLWTAGLYDNGYGQHLGRRAHRVAYEMAIGDIPDGMQIDHRCHTPSCVNPEHLRICSSRQNQHNRRPPKTSRARFKGVRWDKERRKWKAVITVDGRKVDIGRFADETDAARAYDAAALQYFGEFALTNEQLGLLRRPA